MKMRIGLHGAPEILPRFLLIAKPVINHPGMIKKFGVLGVQFKRFMDCFAALLQTLPFL